jgi:excisionase family DNA binding protein
MNKSTPDPEPIPNANPAPKPIAFTIPSTIMPRGDGSFIVTPGKPLIASTLSARELADRFGKSRRTIYRWIREGTIPEQFVDQAGLREVRISSEAVEYLRESFRERHEAPQSPGTNDQ